MPQQKTSQWREANIAARWHAKSKLTSHKTTNGNTSQQQPPQQKQRKKEVQQLKSWIDTTYHKCHLPLPYKWTTSQSHTCHNKKHVNDEQPLPTFQRGNMQEVSLRLIKQQMETPHNNNSLNQNKEKKSSATKVLNWYHIPQVPPNIALQTNYIILYKHCIWSCLLNWKLASAVYPIWSCLLNWKLVPQDKCNCKYYFKDWFLTVNQH